MNLVKVTSSQVKKMNGNKFGGGLNDLTDRLGLGIDEGIRETVVAFNVLRVPTYMSCEGHVEYRGEKVGIKKISPYVSVGMETPDVRFEGESEIRARIAAKFNISPDNIGRYTDEYIQATNEFYDSTKGVSETQEYVRVRNINEQLIGVVGGWLEEFHGIENIPPNLHLKVKGVGPAGHFVVSCDRGKDNIAESDMLQYQGELTEEQEVMSSFTAFLKSKFLDTED